jgi:hypothetical protein
VSQWATSFSCSVPRRKKAGDVWGVNSIGNSNHTIKRAKTQPEKYYNYILDVVSTDCSFEVSFACALNKLITFVLQHPEPKSHVFTYIHSLDSQREQTAA